MPAMTPVPKDHPMWKAWEDFRKSDNFPAGDPQVIADHLDFLWSGFVAGFIAGAKWQKPETEIAQIRVNGERGISSSVRD